MTQTQGSEGRRTRSNAELSREGTNRAVARVTRIARALQYCNQRLAFLADRLREVQKRDHGAILLQLELCSRGCLGCPHPRWVKWVNRREQDRNAPSTWYAARLERPGVAARGRDVPGEVRELVAEAQGIIERRHKLLDMTRRANRMTTMMAGRDPELERVLEGGSSHAEEGS